MGWSGSLGGLTICRFAWRCMSICAPTCSPLVYAVAQLVAQSRAAGWLSSLTPNGLDSSLPDVFGVQPVLGTLPTSDVLCFAVCLPCCWFYYCIGEGPVPTPSLRVANYAQLTLAPMTGAEGPSCRAGNVLTHRSLIPAQLAFIVGVCTALCCCTQPSWPRSRMICINTMAALFGAA